MSILPDEIIVAILLLLPVKSILRFRCVSKHWYELFKDPYFIKYHLKHAVVKGNSASIIHRNCIRHILPTSEGRWLNQSFRRTSLRSVSPLSSSKSYESAEPAIAMKYPFESQDTTLNIFGSCNGLILARFEHTVMHKESGLFLWNPSTKEYRLLPEPVITGSFDGKHRTMHLYGLGYNGIIDDYKIIRIDVFYNVNDANICYGSRVNVYTLGSDSWKALPDIIPHDICTSRNRPVLANGSLHWVGTPMDGQGFRTGSRVVVSFNLENDICAEVPVTQQLHGLLIEVPVNFFEELFRKERSTAVSKDVLLGNLDGCLCILGGFKSGNYLMNIEIWVMKDYGVRESWTKVFCVTSSTSIESSLKMFSRMEFMDYANGEVLIMLGGADDCTHGVSLLIFDPKHETSRLVRIQNIDYSQLETYVESLVSLNSGTFLNRERKNK